MSTKWQRLLSQTSECDGGRGDIEKQRDKTFIPTVADTGVSDGGTFSSDGGYDLPRSSPGDKYAEQDYGL